MARPRASAATFARLLYGRGEEYMSRRHGGVIVSALLRKGRLINVLGHVPNEYSADGFPRRGMPSVFLPPPEMLCKRRNTAVSFLAVSASEKEPTTTILRYPRWLWPIMCVGTMRGRTSSRSHRQHQPPSHRHAGSEVEPTYASPPPRGGRRSTIRCRRSPCVKSNRGCCARMRPG